VYGIHENVGLYSAKAILSFPYFGNGPILGLYPDNLYVHTLVLFHFMFVISPYNCHLSLVGILPLENLMVISLLVVCKEAIISHFSQPSMQVIFSNTFVGLRSLCCFISWTMIVNPWMSWLLSHFYLQLSGLGKTHQQVLKAWVE
jgi:hypothetical protein